MLERYFIRPQTLDQIRASWIGEPIERYVTWLTEEGYASRNVFHRVPVLRHFGEFARARGATRWEDLPAHVAALSRRGCRSAERDGRRCGPGRSWRVRPAIPLNRCSTSWSRALPAARGHAGRANRSRSTPGRSLRICGRSAGSARRPFHHYRHYLAQFDVYLRGIELHDLRALSPAVLGAFVADRSAHLGRTSLRNLCGVVRVFLRYLHRELVLATDLSPSVESPAGVSAGDAPARHHVG